MHDSIFRLCARVCVLACASCMCIMYHALFNTYYAIRRITCCNYIVITCVTAQERHTSAKAVMLFSASPR